MIGDEVDAVATSEVELSLGVTVRCVPLALLSLVAVVLVVVGGLVPVEEEVLGEVS